MGIDRHGAEPISATRQRPAGSEDWRAIVAGAITDPAELCRLLCLPGGLAAQAAEDQLPLRVPRPYLARIRPGDPEDPLLQQILPKREELIPVAGFCHDPVAESGPSPCLGWLGKYNGRLLMVTDGQCAVHCRFCFRRHFAYPREGPAGHWPSALATVARDPAIQEVILSGGDPLMQDDQRLAAWAADLAAVAHLRRLRIHTRLPIVVPQRVTDELLAWLRGTRLTCFMVVHVNHPQEIDRDVADALGRLVDAGIPVLSQSVLLRGINDRFEILAELFQRLVDLRVIPYYLHQLDRVAGAAHFEVPQSEGLRLMAELRASLPGYAVPRYVREVPGKPNKVPLG